MMMPADDPHLVERIARLAVFHDLPTPVVVQMTLMASEILRRPAPQVHEEVERRMAALQAAERRAAPPPPTLRLVSGGSKRRG
jgi:hypothetical protein